MLEDSRCPSGTTCVWAGRISVKIELKDSDGKYEMVLVQPGLSQEHSEDYYKEYKLLYKINPYPQAGTEVEKEDYRLLLTISKQQE